MGRFGGLRAPKLSLPLGWEAACISVSSAELGPGAAAPPPALCPGRRPGNTQPQERAGRARAGGGVCADSAPGQHRTARRSHGPADLASLHRLLSITQTDGALVSERLCGWGPLLGTSVSRARLLPGGAAASRGAPPSFPWTPLFPHPSLPLRLPPSHALPVTRPLRGGPRNVRHQAPEQLRGWDRWRLSPSMSLSSRAGVCGQAPPDCSPPVSLPRTGASS